MPAVVGSLLLVAALDATHAGAAASPFEALLLGCIGVAFAAVLDAPALALALPVFVGVLDVSGVVGEGPGALLAQDAARPGDPLTVEIPGWGGGLPAARVTAAELIFLAAYVAYAHLFGLRPRASAAAMYGALVAVVVAGVAFDRRVPALALMGAAFLAVNADRLGAPVPIGARGVTCHAWTSRRRRSRRPATAARSAARSSRSASWSR